MILLSKMGFLPNNSGLENAKILQEAVDKKGDIYVDEAGTYLLEDTIYIGSDTNLYFCANSYIKRVKNSEETGPVIINKGAYKKEYDSNIGIYGMKLITDGIVSDEAGSNSKKNIMGLSAQLEFFYVNHLIIKDYQCMDLPPKDFGIQICTFSNVLIENVHIEGMKDGVHFGRGNNFVVRHGVFKTFDDPIALNAYDYIISNPEIGWIENGLIEDCYDLDQDRTTGFFSRIPSGGWLEWFKGMKVQWSDTVSYNGRIYRMATDNRGETNTPDGKIYDSITPPSHETGYKEYDDGIIWYMVQEGGAGSCGCRNIRFNGIYLLKQRDCAISMTSAKNAWCRNYYPNAEVAVHKNISFENVYCENSIRKLFESIAPFENVSFTNCDFSNANIVLKDLETEGMLYPYASINIRNSKIKSVSGEMITRAETRGIDVTITDSVFGEENIPDGFERMGGNSYIYSSQKS